MKAEAEATKKRAADEKAETERLEFDIDDLEKRIIKLEEQAKEDETLAKEVCIRSCFCKSSSLL